MDVKKQDDVKVDSGEETMDAETAKPDVDVKAEGKDEGGKEDNETKETEKRR